MSYLYGVLEFKVFNVDRRGNESFKMKGMNEFWNRMNGGLREVVHRDVSVYEVFMIEPLLNNHNYLGSIAVVR